MATIHIEYRTISWGTQSEDDNNNVWEIESTQNDPGEIILADFGTVGDPITSFPAPPTIDQYQFKFWNATNGSNALPGFPNMNQNLSIPPQPEVTFVNATAWYAVPPGSGIGQNILRARTFDIDLNTLRKETPISEAMPQISWAGPNNHSVSTDSAVVGTNGVTISSKNQLVYPAPQATQPANEPSKIFFRWQPIWGSLNLLNDPAKLSSASNQISLAVAFFGHHSANDLTINPGTLAFDFWAEFWGKRGGEGEGPWGPHGPSSPWGPLSQRIGKLAWKDQVTLSSLIQKIKEFK